MGGAVLPGPGGHLVKFSQYEQPDAPTHGLRNATGELLLSLAHKFSIEGEWAQSEIAQYLTDEYDAALFPNALRIYRLVGDSAPSPFAPTPKGGPETRLQLLLILKTANRWRRQIAYEFYTPPPIRRCIRRLRHCPLLRRRNSPYRPSCIPRRLQRAPGITRRLCIRWVCRMSYPQLPRRKRSLGSQRPGVRPMSLGAMVSEARYIPYMGRMALICCSPRLGITSTD